MIIQNRISTYIYVCVINNRYFMGDLARLSRLLRALLMFVGLYFVRVSFVLMTPIPVLTESD